MKKKFLSAISTAFTSALFCSIIAAESEPSHGERTPEDLCQHASFLEHNNHDTSSRAGKANLELAWKLINEAIRRKPNDPLFYVVKASVCKALMMDDETVAAINKAKSIAPLNTTVLTKRSEIMCDLDHFEEGTKDATTCIRLNSKNAYAYRLRATSYALRAMYKEAEEDLDKAIALTPNDQAMRLERANASARTGHLDKIIDDETFVINSKNKTYLRRALRQRAQTYGEQRQFPKAIVDYKAYLNMLPDDRQARLELQKVYERSGDKKNAAEQAKIIKGLDADF